MNYSDSNTPPILNVPLSTALFTVDTRDGLKIENGLIVKSIQNNPYDINIQKNQQLFSGAVQRVSLTELNMTWNIENVNWRNNILYLETNLPATLNINIVYSSQYFLPAELATMVQNSLNGVSSPSDYKYYNDANVEVAAAPVFGNSTWSVTWNPRRNIFIINPQNVATTWRINPKINQYKGSTLFSDGQNVKRNSTIAEMMGFNNVDASYANIFRSSYATMLYTTYVDIVSSILCKNQDVRDTSTSYFNGQNILARVYISSQNLESISTDGSNILGTRPFNLHYVFATPKEIQWNTQEFLPSCNIRLQDDKGDLLYSRSNESNVVAGTQFSGNSGFVQLSMLISEAGTVSGKYTQFG